MPLFNPYPQSDEPSISIRRTTTYSYTTSFANITMDATDINNDPTYLTHDPVNTERINILVGGLYQISYQFQSGAVTNNRMTSGQVLYNNSTILAGSSASIGDAANAANDGPSTVTSTFVASFNSGDYIALQAKNTAGTVSMPAGATLAVVKLSGGKGDVGPAGTSGGVTNLAPVTASGQITTTAVNTSPVVATGMTLTPAAGTYLVIFQGNGWVASPGTGVYIEVSIFAGGVQVTSSANQYADTSNYNKPFVSAAFVTVNGSQAIEARWGVAGGGTGYMQGTRTMNFLKIA